jgi:sulfopyruvate decarboxylase alpha subunit
MAEPGSDWPAEIFEVLQRQNIDVVCHVPDAGHARLIEMCEADNAIDTVTCTTEEEGVHMLSGVFLGGRRGVMLLQSSGVGNIINALAMPNTCRIPMVLLVTMRGEYGEFNTWQVPMGQGTPGCLEAMGVRTHRVDRPDEVAPAVENMTRLAFDSMQSTAVLLSQKLIGAKDFRELAK